MRRRDVDATWEEGSIRVQVEERMEMNYEVELSFSFKNQIDSKLKNTV